MNSAVELHDSTLAGIEPFGPDVVVLRFAPAYVHRSEGEPGVDPGSGWIRDIDLVIIGAAVESRPAELPCGLADGALALGETCWDNVIPMPLAFSGAVSLSAITCGGELLVVRGSGVTVVPRGEPRHVERFPGAADD